MSTFTKAPLSGSSHGKGILVVATAIGSGTTIHTATSGTTDGDDDLITLFVTNNDTVARTLTLGWGGTTDPDDLINIPVNPKVGLMLIVADLPLRNSGVIKAAADAASKVVIHGYVNQIR